MAASPSKDQEFIEQLLVELNKIGVGPTEWLTSPAKPIVEADLSTTPAADSELQLYLVHRMTRATDEEAGGLGMHNRTLDAAVIIFARANATGDRLKKIRQAATDVLRTLYAAESTFEALTGDAGLRVGDFGFESTPESSWFGSGAIPVTIQYESSHSAP